MQNVELQIKKNHFVSVLLRLSWDLIIEIIESDFWFWSQNVCSLASQEDMSIPRYWCDTITDDTSVFLNSIIHANILSFRNFKYIVHEVHKDTFIHLCFLDK